MKPDIIPIPGDIVVSEDEIQQRVRELGAQISRDYAGKKLHLLAVLRGAVPFLADLSRNIMLDVTFDFMALSRDGAGGQVRLIKDLDKPLEGKHVLVVEDIVNEGETLKFLLKALSLRHPLDVKVCTLFDRPSKRKAQVQLDYVGKVLDDRFLVGYGLDYKQMYRNYRHLTELRFGK